MTREEALLRVVEAAQNLNRAHELWAAGSQPQAAFDVAIVDLFVAVAALDALPESGDGWRPIESNTPRDRFIWLWCPEDESRWLAKWQGGLWHGVDDEGLTRDSEDFTPTHWMPLPPAPRGETG